MQNYQDFISKGIYLYNHGRYAEALSFFQKCFVCFPEHADGYWLAGRSLNRLGDKVAALRVLRHAARIAPGQTAVLMELGSILMDQAQWAEAQRVLHRVAAIDPSAFAAYTALAWASFQRMDAPPAIAAYRMALSLNPLDSGVCWNLAVFLEGSGRHAESVTRLRQFTACIPDSAKAQRLLGKTLYTLGEWEPARAACRRAHALDPTDADSLALLEKMIFHRQPRSIRRFPAPRPMVYDCFIFFNELDLLDLRLRELWNEVDRFVLFEAVKTFTNKPKLLYYEENKYRFSEFSEKIIHFVVDEFPEYNDPWQYERYQRNQMNNVLDFCNSKDIIMLSDADEIPSADKISVAAAGKGIAAFEQENHYYYLNCRGTDQPIWWGTKLLRAEEFVVDSQAIRDTRPSRSIPDGGWHFSYLGGLDNIIHKIDSFSHQEYNNSNYVDREKMLKKIMNGEDLYGRGFKFSIVDIDHRYPSVLRTTPERYSHLMTTAQR